MAGYSMSLALQTECCFRLVLSAACGFAIGYERTSRLKEAGIRTHIIVAIGAALMMQVSKYGFFDLSGISELIKFAPSRKALRGLDFRQAVVDAGMQARPLEDTVLTAGQAAIRQALRRAAALGNSFGIPNRLPGIPVLTPFQQEGSSGQRASGSLHLFDGNRTGTQGIDERYLRCLSLDNRNFLGIFAFALV